MVYCAAVFLKLTGSLKIARKLRRHDAFSIAGVKEAGWVPNDGDMMRFSLLLDRQSVPATPANINKAMEDIVKVLKVKMQCFHNDISASQDIGQTNYHSS